jgi:hypothetical protein
VDGDSQRMTDTEGENFDGSCQICREILAYEKRLIEGFEMTRMSVSCGKESWTGRRFGAIRRSWRY